MRQSRTRKKVPRGTVPLDEDMIEAESGIGGGGGGGGQPKGAAGPSGDADNGCVNCHDYYEIHV